MFNYTVSALTERIRDFFGPKGIRTHVSRFNGKNTVLVNDTVLSIIDGRVLINFDSSSFMLRKEGFQSAFFPSAEETRAVEALWKFLFN